MMLVCEAGELFRLAKAKEAHSTVIANVRKKEVFLQHISEKGKGNKT